ncbi:YaaC family protein [Streptomyces gardneri]|uniref:YaaC family protein n=1 Tax=Streptomyces gardneri TaxID=66892 RepID=UPI0037CE8AEF
MVRRPYGTWGEAGQPSSDDVWRALRELRADPPGYAGASARKKVLSSSLEQAEQLFKAAKTVGPASRPLLLFYGLSQAGRAIAASAPVGGGEYRLRGHGITAGRMESPALGDVTVRDSGVGSFTQLAKILNSRSLRSEVPLSDLWAAIPEVANWPLASCTHPLLGFSLDTTPGEFPSMQAVISGIPKKFHAEFKTAEELEASVRDWLSAYPALRDYTFHPGVASWNNEKGTVGYRLTWPVDTQAGAEGRRRRFLEIAPWRGRNLANNNNHYIHARLGDDGSQLHPLLAWWAVLYSLSMLARYESGQWVSHIDVNKSKDAVAIEYLLDRALSCVPELALATIEDAVAGT